MDQFCADRGALWRRFPDAQSELHRYHKAMPGVCTKACAVHLEKKLPLEL